LFAFVGLSLYDASVLSLKLHHCSHVTSRVPCLTRNLENKTTYKELIGTEMVLIRLQKGKEEVR